MTKEERKIYNIKYYQKNKKRIDYIHTIYRKINYQKIKEQRKINYQKIKEQRKINYQKNKEKCKKYNKGYIFFKRKNNYRFRLDENISRSIRRCLKGKKLGRHWEFLVGYTLQDLIQHIEKQFDEKMNWNNQGSYWHIDHIVPQSWFPYQTVEEQAFRDCWDLANLQPLEAKANLSKHNRFVL